MWRTHWIVTLNNPENTQFSWPDKVRYAIWQKEEGEEKKTPHIQAYVEFHRSQRMTAVKKIFGDKAHVEPRRGTREQARDYCSKEETRVEGPWTYGTWDLHQGSRTDLQEAADAIKEGATIKEVATDFPDTYVKFYKGLAALKEQVEETPRDEGFVPREWQREILEKVKQSPDDRKIMWVYDKDGNAGKSRLARHLVLEHGAIQLSGKVADMIYAYDKQRIVIFDVSRTAAENMSHLYDLAERLKNGILFSMKYESKQKVFDPPHVIFFSNSLPDMGVWSKDRYDIKEIFSQPLVQTKLIKTKTYQDVRKASSDRSSRNSYRSSGSSYRGSSSAES